MADLPAIDHDGFDTGELEELLAHPDVRAAVAGAPVVYGVGSGRSSTRSTICGSTP